jgi:hypothetical protein
MKTIPLTRGYVALVDDADYERLSQWKWHALVIPRAGGRQIYAARNVDIDSKSFMHRELMALPDRRKVVHKDGNGLNNQRANLTAVARLTPPKKRKPKASQRMEV